MNLVKAIVLDTALAKGRSWVFSSTGKTAFIDRVSRGNSEKVLVKCRQNVANKLFVTRVLTPYIPHLADSAECSTQTII